MDTSFLRRHGLLAVAVFAGLFVASVTLLSRSASLGSSGQAAVLTASVTVHPTNVRAGEPVGLTVSGLTPNTTLTILLDGEKIKGYYHTTNNKGEYSVTIAVPVSAKNGEHHVTVSSPYLSAVTVKFFVRGGSVHPTLAVSPDTVPAGGNVNLIGKDWYSGHRTVTLVHPDGFKQTLTVLFDTCTRAECPDGELSMGIAIPEDLVPAQYLVVVADNVGAEAGANLWVTEASKAGTPSITLVPDTGIQGLRFYVHGRNFAKDSALTAEWDGKDRIPLGTETRGLEKYEMRTDVYGNFNRALSVVPGIASPGKHWVTVLDPRGNWAYAWFTVTVSQSSSSSAAKSSSSAPSSATQTTVQPASSSSSVMKSSTSVASSEPQQEADPASSSRALSSAVSSRRRGRSSSAKSMRSTPSSGGQASSVSDQEGEELPCESYTFQNRPGRCKKQSASSVSVSIDDLPCDRYTRFNRPDRCQTSSSVSSAPAPKDECDPSQYQFSFNVPEHCRAGATSSRTGTKLSPQECALIPGRWNRPPECSLYEEGSLIPLAGAIHIAGARPSPFSTSLLASVTVTATDVAGTYRCWKMNVGGAGGSCKSPAYVLKKNGTYTLGSKEKGTFSVRDGTISFSKSTFRGAAEILENGMQIRFSYVHSGLQQTVTYLRESGAPILPAPALRPAQEAVGGTDAASAPAAIIPVTVVITFTPQTSVGGISTISLMPEGGGDRYDAIAVQDSVNSQVMTGYFRGVPNGKRYTLMVGPGDVKIGTIDLKTAHSARTINVNGEIRW